jgi:VanZ family protein
MTAIFVSSATPGDEVPTFGIWDYAVKKGGHFLAYAVLAFSYLRASGWHRPTARQAFTVWGMAVAYALLDELHQTFVPGRRASLLDALVFDAGGALAALMVSARMPGGVEDDHSNSRSRSSSSAHSSRR